MINQQINLTFKNIHRKSFEGTLDFFFKGIDEEFAFRLIDLINRNEGNYKTTKGLIEYLSTWFSKNNLTKFNFYADAIDKYSKRFSDCEITIFNPPSTLSFIEMLMIYLKDHQDRDAKRSSDQQMECDLLDAYLVINQSLDKSVTNGIEEIQKTYAKEAISWHFLYKPFQYADLVNKNLVELFLTENAKAIMLFEHFENNPLTRPILESFLVRYDCESWSVYLRAISGMTVLGIDTPNYRGNSLIHIDPELPFYETCIKIIDRISVQVDMAEFSVDYLYLRNHPIRRTGYARFQILSQRFFLEKIFRALYFELREINSKMKQLNDNRFRTEIYTSGYSENKLSYSVLNHIFKHSSYVREGSYMENIDPQFGASDYVAE